MSVAALVRPAVEAVPDAPVSWGAEAAELAAKAGLVLDEWQQLVLEGALRMRDDEKWAAFEVGVNVPRQNGKGGILEARALAGLFLFEERYLIWSAHNFDTSKEGFYRLEGLVRECPDLHAQVRRAPSGKVIGYRYSHGEEGIELHDGRRIRFRTRTKGGGKGFTADCVIFDEAMFLNESFHWALVPTMSARSIVANPQVWYTGSAADELVHDNAVVWARIRERGIRGDDPSLAYFEWSADLELAGPDAVTPDIASDEEVWARANPALGIRISPEHVGHERRSLDDRGFAVERLGVGAYPPADRELQTKVPYKTWRSLEDEDSTLLDPVILAFDVSADRSKAVIAAAGRNPDGLVHVEIVDYRAGTGWVAERLRDLLLKHEVDGIVCDKYAAVIGMDDLVVRVLTAEEHAKACAAMVDAVDQRAVRHLGSPEVASAIRGAQVRPLGDAWAWSRKNSTVDISPLVAVTLAVSVVAGEPGSDWSFYY